MLSLVNYGSSDSEDNISDEEDAILAVNGQGTEKNVENFQNLPAESIMKLPQPINHVHQKVEEEDDEFLHKKEVPLIVPPKVKQKVKIMIPKLSDFKDEDEKIDTGPKYPTASNKKTGLLNMLPKPSHGSVSIKTTLSVTSKANSQQLPTVDHNKSEDIKVTASSSSKPLETKKIGLIPYALMDHKKILDDKRAGKKKSQDSDESDEEEGRSFFTFNSNDEDLPKVNDEEIKAMISKEASRMDERRKKNEKSEEMQYEQQDFSQYYEQHQQEQQLNHEAMKALVGGTKAKRSKLDNIQIVDISDQDVLPDKNEWLRKNLAGETSFIPTGKIDEKGPSALAKRKHQISYLSMRAENNMAELEAIWAANRQSNREGRSKYGF